MAATDDRAVDAGGLSDEHEHVCAACRAIDGFDGHVDGVFFGEGKYHVPDERRRWRRMLDTQDVVADRVTAFAGSLNFVYIHSAWFLVWIILNVGLIGAGLKFDPFPFGLLTMIVSLEAIFLSTFVMVSQNRQAKRADLRAQLEFETNLRAEIWAIHIGSVLGIDHEHVESVVRQALESTNGAEPSIER